MNTGMSSPYRLGVILSSAIIWQGMFLSIKLYEYPLLFHYIPFFSLFHYLIFPMGGGGGAVTFYI